MVALQAFLYTTAPGLASFVQSLYNVSLAVPRSVGQRLRQCFMIRKLRRISSLALKTLGVLRHGRSSSLSLGKLNASQQQGLASGDHALNRRPPFNKIQCLISQLEEAKICFLQYFSCSLPGRLCRGLMLLDSNYHSCRDHHNMSLPLPTKGGHLAGCRMDLFVETCSVHRLLLKNTSQVDHITSSTTSANLAEEGSAVARLGLRRILHVPHLTTSLSPWQTL